MLPQSGNRISLQETFENNDYYREESGTSMPYFARMARLGLCTVDSQEGKRSGRGKSLMSERASVNGFMPKDRAIHMWHSLNLRTLFTACDWPVPKTFSGYPEAALNWPANMEPVNMYRRGGVLYGEPTAVTMTNVQGIGPMKPPKLLPKDWVLVSAFDPTPGRPARQHLYPMVIRHAKQAAAAVSTPRYAQKSG
jgi:hypothetical protein